jgi:hypothetical protein
MLAVALAIGEAPVPAPEMAPVPPRVRRLFDTWKNGEGPQAFDRAMEAIPADDPALGEFADELVDLLCARDATKERIDQVTTALERIPEKGRVAAASRMRRTRDVTARLRLAELRLLLDGCHIGSPSALKKGAASGPERQPMIRDAVAAVRDALRSSDRDSRGKAVLLGDWLRRKAPGILPLLVDQAGREQDEWVMRLLLRSLSRFDPEGRYTRPALAAAVIRWADRDFEVASRAAVYLSKTGSGAKHGLARLRLHANPRARQIAYSETELKHADLQFVAQALFVSFYGRDHEVRRAAFRSLDLLVYHARLEAIQRARAWLRLPERDREGCGVRDVFLE